MQITIAAARKSTSLLPRPLVSPSLMYCARPMTNHSPEEPESGSEVNEQEPVNLLTPVAYGKATTDKTAQYYKTGEFSDFTVEHKGKEDKLHRIIVCPKSKYFANVCNSSFSEGSTRRIEDAFAPNTITLERMIQFLYEGRYMAPQSDRKSVNHDVLTDVAIVNSQTMTQSKNLKRKSREQADQNVNHEQPTAKKGRKQMPIGGAQGRKQAKFAQGQNENAVVIINQQATSTPAPVPTIDLTNYESLTDTPAPGNDNDVALDDLESAESTQSHISITKQAWNKARFHRAALAHARVWIIADYYQIDSLKAYAEACFRDCYKLYNNKNPMTHLALLIGEILQLLPTHAKKMHAQVMQWAIDAGDTLLETKTFKDLIVSDKELNAAFFKAMRQEMKRDKELIASLGLPSKSLWGPHYPTVLGDESLSPSKLPMTA